MTKKQKRWMVFGIIAGTVYSTICLITLILGIASFFYDPFLAPKMVKYYSDDRNFAHFKSVIIEYSLNEKRKNITLLLKNVESLQEGVEAPRYNTDHGISATAFAKDIVTVWENLNPHQNLEIDFYGTFHQFYSSCPNAIVQISVNGKEILNYNEGKEALIEWANTVH